MNCPPPLQDEPSAASILGRGPQFILVHFSVHDSISGRVCHRAVVQDAGTHGPIREAPCGIWYGSCWLTPSHSPCPSWGAASDLYFKINLELLSVALFIKQILIFFPKE